MNQRDFQFLTMWPCFLSSPDLSGELHISGRICTTTTTDRAALVSKQASELVRLGGEASSAVVQRVLRSTS